MIKSKLKLALIALLSILSNIGYGQTIQRSTSKTITLTDERVLFNLILGTPRYRDTTEANLYKAEDSTGTVIHTRNPDAIWFRSNSPKHWINLSTSTTSGSVGPAGPQGIQGIQGPIGPKGDKGDRGLQGTSGINGIQGVQGIQGNTGLEGPIGLTGAIGPKGDKGDKGDAGTIENFEEKDSIFLKSPSRFVTETKITHWDFAYSKVISSLVVTGEQNKTITLNFSDGTAISGTFTDLTGISSYIETDPIFLAHVASSITSTNISNWNTAFGWGNHAGLYSLLGHTHTLDNVLAAGATSNRNITLSDFGSLNAYEIILRENLRTPQIQFFTTEFSTLLRADNNTFQRTIQLPDASGTLIRRVNGIDPNTQGDVEIPFTQNLHQTLLNGYKSNLPIWIVGDTITIQSIGTYIDPNYGIATTDLYLRNSTRSPGLTRLLSSPLSVNQNNEITLPDNTGYVPLFIDEYGADQYGYVSTYGYSEHNSTYTAIATDKKINCISGTFTITLPSHSSLASGKPFIIINNGTGTITVTSTSTFNGATTLTIPSGHGFTILAGISQFYIENQY